MTAPRGPVAALLCTATSLSSTYAQATKSLQCLTAREQQTQSLHAPPLSPLPTGRGSEVLWMLFQRGNSGGRLLRQGRRSTAPSSCCLLAGVRRLSSTERRCMRFEEAFHRRSCCWPWIQRAPTRGCCYESRGSRCTSLLATTGTRLVTISTVAHSQPCMLRAESSGEGFQACGR